MLNNLPGICTISRDTNAEGVRSYTFKFNARKSLVTFPKYDLDEEFGEDQDHWIVYLKYTGIIEYSPVLERYVYWLDRDELEREAKGEAEAEADHIRQERRSDIFR